MLRQKARKWCINVLAAVPGDIKLLYPFYLANQLTALQEIYASPRLPQAFDGLTIAYASDIHYGPYLSEDRAKDLASRITAWQPDLVILGGDYGMDPEWSTAFFHIMPRLHAPCGVVAAIGNHDRTGSSDNLSQLTEAMNNAGVMPLVNDCMHLTREGKQLSICSTDDIKSGTPDLRAVARKTQSSSFVIFAPHSPDIIPALHAIGTFRVDLALCGHTHGSQVVLFGRSLHSSSKYRDRYRTGWIRENGLDIMVSNGVGTSLMPVRLGAPAQVHHITLKSAPGGSPYIIRREG